MFGVLPNVRSSSVVHNMNEVPTLPFDFSLGVRLVSTPLILGAVGRRGLRVKEKERM